jgi:hypothetical protein
MILILRCFFLLVLASMLAVTSWASFRCPLFAVPREVYAHPWFIATMADTYWGFLTFYVWVAYQRTSWVARGAWLVAILLLGNIAMSLYCLAALFRADPAAGLGPVLTARRDGPDWLGVGLAAAGVAVITLAWPANAT